MMERWTAFVTFYHFRMSDDITFKVDPIHEGLPTGAFPMRTYYGFTVKIEPKYVTHFTMEHIKYLLEYVLRPCIFEMVDMSDTFVTF